MEGGVTWTLKAEGLSASLTRLELIGRMEYHELLDGLGSLGISQTQRRIQSEKTTPEGKAWKPTSDGRGALFVTGSNLYDSIQARAGTNQVEWGSGWKGARVHQFGAVIKPVNARVLAFSIGGKKVFAKKVTIPARAYIGISDANGREIVQTAERFIGRYVQ